MEQESKVVDYYKVLECDKSASDEEIKSNYDRLISATHPDKQKMDCATFHLLLKALTVLTNPESRKLYDAMLSWTQEHGDFLIYKSLTPSDMTYYSHHGVYIYYCWCGGMYELEECDAGKSLFIGCDECSYSIQVN